MVDDAVDTGQAVKRDNAWDLVWEDVDCPLGCPRGDQHVLTGRDRLHHLPGEFAVVKCQTCGLLRTNPRPAPESMARYYPDDYGPYLGTRMPAQAPNPKSLARRYLAPAVRRLLDSKAHALPPVPTGRLLEVGCASGAFLHAMTLRGWQVAGIEFSASAASEAQRLGYPVHVGALEDTPDDGARFDLIVAWMVLEHLHDPVNGLRILAERSRPGAWLAISTPDATASEYRFFQSCWYDLHLPNHLYHFTPKTLAAVLEAGGWSIESVQHQRSINNFLTSCAFYLDDRHWPRTAGVFRGIARGGRFWTATLFPVACLAALLGKTGRMTVWARRQT